LLSKLLKEGRITHLSLLERDIKNFWGLSLENQTALIVYGRNIPEVRKLLEKYLPLEEDIKEALLTGKFIEVTIPSVDKNANSGKLTKAYLISDTPKVWTNAKEYLHLLESKLRPLTGKNFIVLFEKTYDGYSFLLPLAVGLLEPQLLERYCFSGNLNADGSLLPVKGIKEKQTACGEKLLFTSNEFSHIKDLIGYAKSFPKAVPILISAKNRDKETLEKDYLSLVSNIKTLPQAGFFERLFETPPYVELGRLEKSEDWKKALKIFETFIRKTDSLFEDGCLHLGLQAPSALAFAYGIMHGTHKEAVFYHYQGQKYHPTVVISEETSREIKRFIENPKRVKAEFIPSEGSGDSKTLSVVLDMVSHPIRESVLKFLREQRLNSDVLVIQHRDRGILDHTRLWTEDIAETFSLIREYSSRKPYGEINFFFGTPVAFAFGLGCAFGHYAKGRIYNFYRDRNPQYVEVLRLEEIDKVR